MFLLNPFLYPHSSTLINLIHTRSIIQYVEPFSTVRIDSMAHAFDLSPEDMLTLVEGLVTDKRMAGKIDRVDRVSDRSYWISTAFTDHF
jgi:COP9 signalosome complex subunit 1